MLDDGLCIMGVFYYFDDLGLVFVGQFYMWYVYLFGFMFYDGFGKFDGLDQVMFGIEMQ